MTAEEREKAKEYDRRLAIIKNRDNEIREALEFFCSVRTDLNKDGNCQDVATKAGLSKSTVWDIITYRSAYEKKNLTTL